MATLLLHSFLLIPHPHVHRASSRRHRRGPHSVYRLRRPPKARVCSSLTTQRSLATRLPSTFTRAEAHLQRLAVEQPAEVLLVLAQVGAQGVGGFQLDVSLVKNRLYCYRPVVD